MVASAFWLRRDERLAVLDPRLRETIKTQELFQDLESLEPSLTKVPLRASEILGFKVPKHQNPWKNCAARAWKRPITIETRDFSPWLLKSEDPAKMTYSIPDFVSRNTINIQHLFQQLP